MWRLSQEQTQRLSTLQRQRDLQRLATVLASALPSARERLGARFDEFVAHGATRAAACGLTHMVCVTRYLASWAVCGADFDTRQPWAAAILTDDKRHEGAKAYQLCVRVQEQLHSTPQTGQPAAAEFAQAVRHIDQQLARAGKLASLLPREPIQLGAACDVDAVELRLVDQAWRQHYTAVGGPWRREACAPQAASVMLVQDALADTAPQLPTQITLLSRAAYGDAAARLRVRVKATHRCDGEWHPLLQCQGPTGARALRGDMAGDATFSVQAQAVAADAGTLAHIGEEDSAQFSVLTVASCGLRARGQPIAGISTLLAAYDATQHLIAWRREPGPGWLLPVETAPAAVPARCRREADGQLVDATAWPRGFQALDAQLQQGLARLCTAWERESGVSDGKLAVEAAVLVGSAGITWGWAEKPEGIGVPPYMRLEGLFDLIACRLALRFTGTLARAGSRSVLSLSTDTSVPLAGAWQRGPEDAALFSVAATLQASVRQSFVLTVQPLADTGLAVLGGHALLRGAISGAVGLEQRPDGPGLRWFVRLNVEPVVAQLRVIDPLLGVQLLQQPLLPAQALVEWSQA